MEESGARIDRVSGLSERYSSCISLYFMVHLSRRHYMKRKVVLKVAAALFIAYGSLGVLPMYAHDHINHACPKNKHNPQASCPGHKRPSDKDKNSPKGGVDTIGCGCSSPWDVFMCFAGY